MAENAPKNKTSNQQNHLFLFLVGFLLLALGGERDLFALGTQEKMELSGPAAEHFLRAVEREDQGQQDSAILEYQAYIQAKPSIPYPYYYLGNLYFELGQAQKGEEQFRKGAEACPG